MRESGKAWLEASHGLRAIHIDLTCPKPGLVVCDFACKNFLLSS